jgi:dTDP-glucose 4,6-dehydratase
MTRILVTGGAGFIGSNFIHHLIHGSKDERSPSCCPDHAPYYKKTKRKEVEVWNVDKLTYAGDLRNLKGVDKSARYHFVKADIVDGAAMRKVFKEVRPDAVVHFAAESHVDRSIDSGVAFVETNVLGTQVLLDQARLCDVPRFLHVSTDEVYGSVDKGSSKETDPLRPSSPYSASKAGSDLLALAHHHTYGLPVLVTRCTNNYGPRQHPEKLIPLMISNALRDQRLPVYGDGQQVRDWLYVKDHCAAIQFLLERKEAGQVFHIGGRDERTNLETVLLLLDLLGKPKSLIQYVKDRPGHDRRYSLDDRRLRRLGWRPRVGFEQGLQYTIDDVRTRAKT